MFFSTREEWEVKNLPLPLLFMEQGERLYQLVELSLNHILFHIDVLPAQADLWTRYIMVDVNHVLSLLGRDDIEKARISIQSRLDGSEKYTDYRISTVKEIQQAEDCYGQTSYIYVCTNGERYIDSPIGKTEEELTNITSVYFQASSM